MTFDEWGEHFLPYGPQVGEPMPRLNVVDHLGGDVALASLWAGCPAVLVSASLTCPVARSRIPALTTLLDVHGERIRRGVLYTKEAHPEVDRAPHAEGEWITPANEREGILHRQPTTISARLALANVMRDGWTPGYHYCVDGMDDALYDMFGTAPCMGLLVDADGIVRAKQGWLTPKALAAAVTDILN